MTEENIIHFLVKCAKIQYTFGSFGLTGGNLCNLDFILTL